MNDLSGIERDAVARIDAAAMLTQVERWVAVNSGTRNLDGVERMGAMLADAFATLPGDIAFVDPAPVSTVGIDGTPRPIDHGRHLTISVRPDATRRMLFTGHFDTVYPADHSFQHATWLPDGTLNAPGAADMKGGLAVILAALQAIEATPVASSFGYDIVLNADEETGSLSSAALLAQKAADKVAAFTYEPALPDGTLAGARGGSGNFALAVTGRSAHAGRNPQDGRNAIVAAADLAVRLADAGGPGLSVNPARIEGGGPNNVVPDHALLSVNFRPADNGAAERARSLLVDSVAAVGAAHDVAIATHGGFTRPPKPVDAHAERLFALVRTCGAALGQPIAWRATGGVCDGNNIAACGVPVIDTMGARGGAIHSSGEYLIVESLAERAALSAVAILRIAAGAMA